MHKRKSLSIIFGVIIVIGFLTVHYVRRQYVVPILMYHSVSPAAQPANALAVRDSTFARQMRFLKEHHYQVLPLETLAGLIREKKQIPPKAIAITLDDGYKDNYLYAFPILKKYNLPATVFIIINEVGRPQNDRLSWEEIKQMQESGIITFGSHTFGPDPLIKIRSEVDLKSEIFDSKRILEEKLGRPVTFFSYPEGMFNGKIRQLVVEAGYQGAVATNPGRGYSSVDVFALKRLRISENAANPLIFAVETSGCYTFMKEWKKQRHGKK